MGLLNKLTQEGSNLSEFDGTTPPNSDIDPHHNQLFTTNIQLMVLLT
jgi:hypothetical protein